MACLVSRPAGRARRREPGQAFTAAPSWRGRNASPERGRRGGFISPNASGAAGRRGASVQLKALEEATSAQTARRGARPDSARAAPAEEVRLDNANPAARRAAG
jgi:hypothetical protein